MINFKTHSDLYSSLRRSKDAPHCIKLMKEQVEETGDMFAINQSKALSDTKAFEKQLTTARDWGLSNAAAFIEKWRTGDPEANERMKNEFLMSKSKVKEHFIQRAYAMMDVKPLEFRNSAYENKIFSIYTISTQDDYAFMRLYKEFMNMKWKCLGTYAEDLDLTYLFWTIYPFSKQPNYEPILKLH